MGKVFSVQFSVFSARQSAARRLSRAQLDAAAAKNRLQRLERGLQSAAMPEIAWEAELSEARGKSGRCCGLKSALRLVVVSRHALLLQQRAACDSPSPGGEGRMESGRLFLAVIALAISLTYAVIGTVLVPRLWADPLGPMLKIWPVMVLNLVALAILEDR